MARLDFDVPSFFARLLEQVGLDCPLPNKLGKIKAMPLQ
jgi:hypothetical protein